MTPSLVMNDLHVSHRKYSDHFADPMTFHAEPAAG